MFIIWACEEPQVFSRQGGTVFHSGGVAVCKAELSANPGKRSGVERRGGAGADDLICPVLFCLSRRAAAVHPCVQTVGRDDISLIQ